MLTDPRPSESVASTKSNPPALPLKPKPPKETMSCWHILNIAPTNDERAIKRAYAKLLKTTRPDDDAEGYQRLREAFDEALAIAPYIESEAAPEWSFLASERLPENERSEFLRS